LKAKIPFLITFALSALFLKGFFDGLSSLNPLSVLILLLSILYLSYIVIENLKDEKPAFYGGLGTGLLLIVSTKAIFLTLAGNSLNPYPIDFLLLIILAYFSTLMNTAIYAFFISMVDMAHLYLNTAAPLFAKSAYAIIMMFIAAIAAGSIYGRDKKTRERLEGLLKNMADGGRGPLPGKSPAGADGIMAQDNRKDLIYTEPVNAASGWASNAVRMVKDMINSHNCVLFKVDKDRLSAIAAASHDKDIYYELPMESSGNLLGWIAEHRVPLRIAEVRDIKGISYYTKDKKINSFLGVPVFGDGDELKGILCADSQKYDAFSVEAERFLVMAAQGVSEFLKNISILHQMDTERSKFIAFYNLTKRLGSTLRFDEIFDIVVESSMGIIDYDMAAFILKEDQDTLRIASAKGLMAAELFDRKLRPDESIAGAVLKNGKSLLFQNLQGSKREASLFPWISLPIRSLLCLPLIVKEDTIGVFVLASKRENYFSQYVVNIFEVIAAHTAIALSNARMYQQMEKMATIDGLTGLFNHRCFQERLSDELERAERYKEKLSLLLLDIDHFKKVNDTYGHPAGDKILKEVAKILNSSVRGVDVAARYGGEEFAVVLVNTGSKGALETAERIRKIMEGSKFDTGSTNIRITGSMGIAVFPDDTGMLDQNSNQRLLISRADSALYTAKEEGRNRVYLFKDVSDRIEERREKTG